MYREKTEPKYYKIRADVARGFVACIGLLIIIVAVGKYWLKDKESGEIKPEEHRERIEVNYDDLKSELKNIELCYLCGNNRKSLMGYYRKFDTIGLISLNDWYVLDFPLKVYDEEGKEIEKSDSNSVRYGNTGEITYSVHGTPSRGMAEIDVTLSENYKVDIGNLQKNLCQECLDKVGVSLEYWKWNDEEKEGIPLCLVDFETLEIYSLQDYYCSYFIRDFFVEIDCGENNIKVEVFYLPEI